jgi:hypothetical protein
MGGGKVFRAHTFLEETRANALGDDTLSRTVNEIIAKRMVKKQQMRWNRFTVQRFLDVRIHVLNGTLEDAFRHWHKGFRPVDIQMTEVFKSHSSLETFLYGLHFKNGVRLSRDVRPQEAAV